MIDPLSDKRKDQIMQEFRKEWEEKYQRILATGWIASDEGVVAATMAIILTAREYRLFSPDYRALLKRIEEWI
jgi:hypothetical protein